MDRAAHFPRTIRLCYFSASAPKDFAHDCIRKTPHSEELDSVCPQAGTSRNRCHGFVRHQRHAYRARCAGRGRAIQATPLPGHFRPARLVSRFCAAGRCLDRLRDGYSVCPRFRRTSPNCHPRESYGRTGPGQRCSRLGNPLGFVCRQPSVHWNVRGMSAG